MEIYQDYREFNAEVEQSNYPNHTFKPGQKVVIGFLVFLGLVTLIFGAFQMKNNLISPYNAGAGTASAKDLNLADTSFGYDVESQKKTDTDADGLNDYDELNVYKTSPYLKDTDSDGYSDKEEIDTGHDPLCASGKDCALSSSTTDTTTNTGTTNTTTTGVVNPGNITNKNTTDKKTLPAGVTIDQIKTLAKKQGMTDDQLAKLTDQQIIDAYYQALEQTGGQTTTGTGATSTTNTQNSASTDNSTLINPTPAQIREILLKSGKVSQTDLNKIDDQTLLNMYKQAYQSAYQDYQSQKK